MQGINLSEQLHIVNLLPPQNVTGLSNAAPINPAFAMKNYAHASIIIVFGAEATQDATNLIIYLCSSAAGAGAVAIPYNYYFQSAGGAGNDVLSAIQNATAAGVTLAVGNAPPNGMIVIEIDARELESASVGGALAGSLGIDAYIGIGLGAPAAADYAAIVVVLSGSSYANVSSPTATT